MKNEKKMRGINDTDTPLNLAIEKADRGVIVGYDFNKGRTFVRIDIRAKIKEKLREKSITQTNLAKQCDIHTQTMSDFLRGRRPLPLNKLEEIFAILEML